MSEFADVLAIYGAIDRAARDDAVLRSQVAPFLPWSEAMGADADADAEGSFGWYDRFVEASSTFGSEAPPSLDDALGRLSAIEPEGRLGIRRLLALGIALKFHIAIAPALGPERLFNALGVGEASGKQLAALLQASDDLPGVLVQAEAQGLMPQLVASTTAYMVADGPIDLECTTVPHADGSASVEASFKIRRTKAMTFAKVTKFLDPSLWTKHWFWCSMTPAPTTPAAVADLGGTTYVEVVSTNCPSWTISAWLDFARKETPVTDGPNAQGRTRRLSFQLSAAQPADGQLLVDEGWLRVTEHADHFLIDTYKRFQFQNKKLVPAQLLCLADYGKQAYTLVVKCSGVSP